MARRWLFVRIHDSARTSSASANVPAVLPAVARLVRAADPDACLFFDRVDDPIGNAVEVWLDARSEVRRDAAALLREPGDGWRASTPKLVTRAVRHPHESGRDVTDELAAVSSEFALACGPGGDFDVAFGLAVAHLRGLAGLAVGDGRALAFQWWLHFADGLSPRRRVDLPVEAAMRADDAPAEPSPPLRWYVARTAMLVHARPAGDGLPPNYLLFAQATATHHRLALPADAGAAAAHTVREEFARDSALALAGRPA
jgi:hypothetical protein